MFSIPLAFTFQAQLIYAVFTISKALLNFTKNPFTEHAFTLIDLFMIFTLNRTFQDNFSILTVNVKS